MLDLFGVMNAEMGMKGSEVDPDFEHSEGEKGLMPLPDNLQFWNGEDAPEEDEDLSLEENVSEFITYLGAIKNRPLWRKHGGVPFYHGLFGEEIDEAGQMHLLAAVVHGWFTPYTYPSGANPDFIAIACALASLAKRVMVSQSPLANKSEVTNHVPPTVATLGNDK